jgi:FSR family fosmidomycin resistance protein-like MFS transporter
LSILRNKTLINVSLGHFATDLCASFMPLVWPVLSGPLNMNYGMIGLASTIYTAASSVTQPIFGYFGDRSHSRRWAALGLAFAAVFVGLIGFVDSYPMLIALVILMGLGVSAFHPQGAMNAAISAGPNKATAMSIFSMGGTGAYAVGPLLAGWLFTTPLGLKSTTLIILPGLLAAVWLLRVMRVVDQQKAASAGARADAVQAPVNLVAFVALVIVVGLRAWTYTATYTYLPLLFKELGQPLTFSGQVLFALQSGGVIGLLAGGFLADRFGRRKTTALALLLLAPATFFLYHTPVVLAPVFAFAFGVLGEAPLPITTVMGQDLLPRNVGVASGLIFGLAFVTGGIGVSLTGVLADAWGLLGALTMLPFLPLVGAALCLLLPRRHAAGYVHPSPHA